MAVIFIFSSTPSSDLPSYGFWDTLVKKGGHMIGYGLLSVSYMYGLKDRNNKAWLAWLLSLLYAASDEYHQSFTPGRTPSPVDVIFFDGIGASVGLGLIRIWSKRHEWFSWL